jgi:hypothetical protein
MRTRENPSILWVQKTRENPSGNHNFFIFFCGSLLKKVNEVRSLNLLGKKNCGAMTFLRPSFLPVFITCLHCALDGIA